MIVSRSHKICGIKMVNIENFIVVLIKCFHESFLWYIPLFQRKIFTNTA
jgi:hypothetical protein